MSNDGWKFAGELSRALIKIRPLGGSELFVKRNGQYYADPDYCGAAIEAQRKDSHETKAENIRLQRRVMAFEGKLDEALGIIHDLLGLDLGSSERAMKFLDDHAPTAADVRGILDPVGEGKVT